jgi:DNA-binding MarR family transcriptional regulator
MGSNTSRDALDALRRIVQALRESSRVAERAGLSGAQLFVLRTLAESPGVSLNDLAARTRTHQSSVSAVVSKLARRRLVEKRTSPRDARRAELRLSAAGRTRLARAPQTAHERLVAAVDAMSPAKRRRLVVTLDGLVRAMALTRTRPAMFFEEATRHGRMTTDRPMTNDQ